MREIKFRAWDKYENCMYPWERLLSFRYNERWFIDNTNKKYINCLFTDEALTIEQYTGLNDKNGNEIYEGDVIIDRRLSDRATYLISYDNDRAFYRANGTDKELNLTTHSFEWKNCEIIGNIHENPELTNQ